MHVRTRHYASSHPLRTDTWRVCWTVSKLLLELTCRTAVCVPPGRCNSAAGRLQSAAKETQQAPARRQVPMTGHSRDVAWPVCRDAPGSRMFRESRRSTRSSCRQRSVAERPAFGYAAHGPNEKWRHGICTATADDRCGNTPLHAQGMHAVCKTAPVQLARSCTNRETNLRACNNLNSRLILRPSSAKVHAHV